MKEAKQLEQELGFRVTEDGEIVPVEAADLHNVSGGEEPVIVDRRQLRALWFKCVCMMISREELSRLRRDAEVAVGDKEVLMQELEVMTDYRNHFAQEAQRLRGELQSMRKQ